MAAAKFPLIMPNCDEQITTIEELQKYYDLPKVIAYYFDGKLEKWLENFGYDDEAEKVSVLNTSSDDFIDRLCEILGLRRPISQEERIDLNEIKKRNAHREILKRYTSDDNIIAAVDRVAFSQEDLEDLLHSGVKDIYLLRHEFDEFIIPEEYDELTYHRINDPVVKYSRIIRLEKAIECGDTKAAVELERFKADILNDPESQVELGSRYYSSGDRTEENYKEAVRWYQKAAEQGNPSAQCRLGFCYINGKGVEKDKDEGEKLLIKAAEKGYAEAQYCLGLCYIIGKSVLVDKDDGKKLLIKAAAAEQVNAEAQYYLGRYYANVTPNDIKVEELYSKAAELRYTYMGRYYDGVDNSDDKKVEKLYSKAAEQGYAPAQYGLGMCYEIGFGVEQNCEEAIEWFRKAAEQGDVTAQVYLVCCYRYDERIGKEEAISWLLKAAAQKNSEAKNMLIGIAPKQFSLSEVIIYALCGKDNIDFGEILRGNGVIIIHVKNKANINLDIFREYGAITAVFKPDCAPKKDSNKWKKVGKAVGKVAKVVGKVAIGYYGVAAVHHAKKSDSSKKKVESPSGYVYLEFPRITAEMKDDFEQNIIE